MKVTLDRSFLDRYFGPALKEETLHVRMRACVRASATRQMRPSISCGRSPLLAVRGVQRLRQSSGQASLSPGSGVEERRSGAQSLWWRREGGCGGAWRLMTTLRIATTISSRTDSRSGQVDPSHHTVTTRPPHGHHTATTRPAHGQHTATTRSPHGLSLSLTDTYVSDHVLVQGKGATRCGTFLAPPGCGAVVVIPSLGAALCAGLFESLKEAT
eukprot:gene1049-biopygen13783